MQNQDTIFHKIINKEIPADIIFEDTKCIVIKDINPVSPMHFLVIPKKTIPSLDNVTSEDESLLGHLLLISAKIAKKQGIAEEGYRVVINTGKHGSQTVFQLHIHVCGGRQFEWPPG